MKSKIKQKIKKKMMITPLILVVVLGLLAGVVGGLIVRVYLFESAYSIPFFGNISFSDSNYNGANLVIRGARKVVVEQNIKVVETINSINTSLVGIFKKQPAVVDETKAEFNLANYYKPNQAISSGLIITSDGWIITNAFIPNANINNILSGYVIVSKDKKVYEIDKAIKDTVSSFYFIHAAGVRDLPVRQFSGPSDLGGGQLAIAIDWPDKSWLSSIIGLEQETIALRFSDSFLKNLILADDLSADLGGAIVFNLAGNIAGLMNREGEIKPITQFIAAIASLLKNGEIRRPNLGINYIDLSSLIAAGESITEYKQGALIYKNLDGVDVVKASPAYLVGLRSGDIITHIDNIEINRNNDLTAVLQNYLAGDKVSITYLRAGERKEVELELGEIK